MGWRSRHRAYGHGYRLVVAILLLATLVVAGGASRGDEDLQVVVRLAAIAAIAASLWPLELAPLRRHKVLLGGITAAYGLLLLQLLPLPPGVWGTLPGHAVYARIMVAGDVVGWRPLSLTPDLTQDALWALLPVAAAGLSSIYLDSRGRARLVEMVVAAACISALLGLVQLGAGGTAFHLYRQSNENSAVGLFANRNHQAVLIACALPLLGAIAGNRLRRGGDGRLIGVLAVAAAMLLVLGVASTGSRMGLVVGMVGLVGAGLCAHVSGGLPRRWRRRHWGTALTIGGALGVATAAAAARSGVVDRLTATDTVSETRLAMLQPLLHTARAFMPFGAGFGAFDSIYRQFEPDALLSTIYMNQAHDEVLQLAIEGGVPALLLLGLFCFWWARAAGRVFGSAIPGPRRATGLAALTVTVILMASSLVDYPLRTPMLGAVFIFACVELSRAGAPRAQTAEPQDVSEVVTEGSTARLNPGSPMLIPS